MGTVNLRRRFRARQPVDRARLTALHDNLRAASPHRKFDTKIHVFQDGFQRVMDGFDLAHLPTDGSDVTFEFEEDLPLLARGTRIWFIVALSGERDVSVDVWAADDKTCESYTGIIERALDLGPWEREEEEEEEEETEPPPFGGARVVKLADRIKRFSRASAQCYVQGCRDLLDPDDRHSWRGPATELREAVREALDALAPPNEVKAQPGFQSEDEEDRPTRRQRALYALRASGNNERASAVGAADTLEGMWAALVVSTYSHQSGGVHADLNREGVEQMHRLAEVVLWQFVHAWEREHPRSVEEAS